MDILDQGLEHLRHVRPLKPGGTQVRVGAPILLESNKRAEIVDVKEKRVYLYDEGEPGRFIFGTEMIASIECEFHKCQLLIKNEKLLSELSHFISTGHYETLADWRQYHLPKSLLGIPAQVFEVHLTHPHRLTAGDEIDLLVCASDASSNHGACDRVVYTAGVLKYME